MIDANVIYSALVYPNSNIAKMVKHIKEKHALVLCKFIINEAVGIFQNKYPHLYFEFKYHIENLPDEIHNMSGYDIDQCPAIRDKKDIPVLAAAIESKVDMFIAGDKDFDEIKVDKPRIMTPRQYYDEFMV